MAKVVVEFDTNTKIMTATIDGVELADVMEACFYGRHDMGGMGGMETEDEKFGFSITQLQKDSTNDLNTWVRITAARSAPRPGEKPILSCVIDRQTKGERGK